MIGLRITPPDAALGMAEVSQRRPWGRRILAWSRRDEVIALPGHPPAAPQSRDPARH